MRDEINRLPKGFAWVTDAKEIESYIPPEALKNIWKKTVNRIGPYEPFSTASGKGYFQEKSGLKSFNKVEFAQSVLPHLTLPDLMDTFEWPEKFKRVVETIQSWNT